MAEQKVIHRARLFWYPGAQKVEIRCIDCGELLVENPLDPETVFYLPGHCQPGETVSVTLQDGIKARDKLK